MQRAVNSHIAGSNPADAAIKRPGVMATRPAHIWSILSSNLRGATTYTITHSHLLPHHTLYTGQKVMNATLHQHPQHQQTCTTAGRFVMGIGVTSNVPGFDPVVPGAAPGFPELCLSYSGFITPGCDSGNVDSISIRHPNMGAISKDRNAAACNPATQPCKSAIALNLRETSPLMRKNIQHRIWRHHLAS